MFSCANKILQAYRVFLHQNAVVLRDLLLENVEILLTQIIEIHLKGLNLYFSLEFKIISIAPAGLLQKNDLAEKQ